MLSAPRWLLPLLLSWTCGAADFDLIIRGARIADGSGNPWFVADIGIRGDTIAAMGKLDGRSATVEIQARGLTAVPGFIDIHSHGRRGIFESPAAENYIRQGVTTIIEGPDGSSPFPIGDFLEKLSRTPVAVNFGLFVGQGTIRSQVVGLENRKADPEELGKMEALVEEAMRAGAFGLSAGLFYIPGNYTPTEELITLARAAGRWGGIYIAHIRDEADGVVESVRETIRIGEEGRLPVQVTHHKIIGRANWGRSAETLRLIEEARARGVDVTLDQYPYTATSTGTAALFPQWAQEGGQEGLLKRLADPVLRGRIKAEVVHRILHDRGAGDPANVVIASCSFDSSLAGKNLAEITKERGREPSLENAAETAIELQQQGGCSAIYHAVREDDVERILEAPFTMVASDGGIPAFGEGAPHPRNYGTFARILGHYVRERRLLRFEDAVRRMSSFPAARLGLRDRGLLRPGMKADIAVLDAGTIADRATFRDPHQYAVGVRHVLVNGKPVLLDGAMTGARPGRVLYGPGARAAARPATALTAPQSARFLQASASDPRHPASAPRRIPAAQWSGQAARP